MTVNRTIALDAMGGDYGPSETVRGAAIAAAKGGVEILLVGDKAAISQVLADQSIEDLPIKIVPSEGVVIEGEHPARAIMAKPKSSP